MTVPNYYKAGRFFPTKKYETFSKIYGKKEIVSYDVSLCEFRFENGLEEYTEIINWKSLLQIPLKSDEQIIAYYKNPTENQKFHSLDKAFVFCGYDLSEESTGISAITNCGGGFDKVYELWRTL